MPTMKRVITLANNADSLLISNISGRVATIKFEFSQLRAPIIQAPMAGGLNTPLLASAVCNAGGVGSFGFAYTSAEKISQDLLDTKVLTAGPVNANFFIFQPVEMPSKQVIVDAVAALSGFSLDDDYTLTIPAPPFFPDITQQLEAIWALPPAILTFHFGIPSPAIIQAAHSRNISVGITATNVEEALAIVKSGADFIVAQGIEAGGHRGTFNAVGEDSELPTEQLVRDLVKATPLPVVAAGGIMSGQDINRVLDLGAVAAQMGTGFLCCDEAGTPPSYRAMLLSDEARSAQFTRGFSGRRAQGISNRFMAFMDNKPTLPFPIQNTLTGPIRKIAARSGNAEFQSLWAGRSYAKTRSMPVKRLIQVLREEMNDDR